MGELSWLWMWEIGEIGLNVLLNVEEELNIEIEIVQILPLLMVEFSALEIVLRLKNVTLTPAQ